MDSSALIYILIFVGLFVYSLLKNKMKSDEKREESRAKSQTISTGVEPMTFPSRKSAPTRKPSDPFLTTEMDTYDSVKDNRKLKKHTKKNAPVEKPIDSSENNYGTDNGFSMKTVEDARRAFIASEIWNRKY